MFKFKHVYKTINGVSLLDNIDFTMESGEIAVILGSSGVGKTTFLRCINLLDIPDSGKMEIDEQALDFQHYQKKELLKMRRKTATVFQEYHLFKNLTVLENIIEGLIFVKKMKNKEAQNIGLSLLKKIEMVEFKDYYPKQLSGGQQQRVAILRAVALKPSILLLDEPTSALDSMNIDVIKKAIQECSSLGMSILVVTHDENFADEIAHSIYCLTAEGLIRRNSKKKLR